VHCTKLNVGVQGVLAHLLQTPIMGVSSLNLGRAFRARPFFDQIFAKQGQINNWSIDRNTYRLTF
jgi:hypothetical protein